MAARSALAGARPLLVVAAFAPELAAFPRRRGVATAVVGVGLVEAAAGMAQALAERRPRAVILVGTAGVYGAAGRTDLPIGGVAVVRGLTLASLAVAQGAAYLPGPLPSSLVTSAPVRRALAAAGARLADVACPLGITRARAAADTLARASGAALENLEAFAVARACARARVPFGAVLGITNAVGPRAHAQWRANARPAAAGACALVAAALARL
jgi:nucleoside phosphorylase